MVIRRQREYAELQEQKNREQINVKNHLKISVCKASLIRNSQKGCRTWIEKRRL